MKPSESSLQRLLRSAAQVPDDTTLSVPFGFDTRVVALWRANGGLNGTGIVRLVRRVALIAAVILVGSGVASFREMRSAQNVIEPSSNEFAIADTAIENEFDQ
ncbi:MAG: hypothetical protein ACJ8M1_11870 [Chthoniobacterales bacterium]